MLQVLQRAPGGKLIGPPRAVARPLIAPAILATTLQGWDPPTPTRAQRSQRWGRDLRNVLLAPCRYTELTRSFS